MADYIPHGRIGGTAACVIANGEFYDRTLFTLWEEMTGRKEPDNLDWVLRVQMGSATEQLNARWYEHVTGHNVDYWGSNVDLKVHLEHDFVVGQIDGAIFRPGDDPSGYPGLLECKHGGHTQTIRKYEERYYPQIQHYLAVTGWHWAALSAFFGTAKHDFTIIERDNEYIAQLIEREKDFWRLVVMNIPPSVKPTEAALAPTVPPTKKVDMTGNNEWGAAAADWLSNKKAANDFKKADASLKSIMPDDAVEASGHGVIIKRTAAGSKRINAG